MVYKNAVAKIQAAGMKIHKTNKSPLDGAKLLAERKEPGIFATLIRTYKAEQ
jgi:hypothetical protein